MFIYTTKKGTTDLKYSDWVKKILSELWNRCRIKWVMKSLSFFYLDLTTFLIVVFAFRKKFNLSYHIWVLGIWKLKTHTLNKNTTMILFEQHVSSAFECCYHSNLKCCTHFWAIWAQKWGFCFGSPGLWLGFPNIQCILFSRKYLCQV